MPQGLWLIVAERAPLVAQDEIGENCLARDCGLAFGDLRPRSIRQIDIEPRAEANEPEPLAGADRLAFADETHNAPRHQARDLDHADAAVRRGDHERIALIVFARLVELGVDE